MRSGTGARLKKDAFGSCGFSISSPKVVGPSTTTVNVVLSFEDALKLDHPMQCRGNRHLLIGSVQ